MLVFAVLHVLPNHQSINDYREDRQSIQEMVLFLIPFIHCKSKSSYFIFSCFIGGSENPINGRKLFTMDNEAGDSHTHTNEDNQKENIISVLRNIRDNFDKVRKRLYNCDILAIYHRFELL